MSALLLSFLLWSFGTPQTRFDEIGVIRLYWRFDACDLVGLDSRDRLVVRTLRCGRSNPGSNPGHGSVVVCVQICATKYAVTEEVVDVRLFFFYCLTSSEALNEREREHVCSTQKLL